MKKNTLIILVVLILLWLWWTRQEESSSVVIGPVSIGGESLPVGYGGGCKEYDGLKSVICS